MIASLVAYLFGGGVPDVIGTVVPHWSDRRVQEAEHETEHYLGTAARLGTGQKVWKRDEQAIAKREARLLEMAQREFTSRRAAR